MDENDYRYNPKKDSADRGRTARNDYRRNTLRSQIYSDPILGDDAGTVNDVQRHSSSNKDMNRDQINENEKSRVKRSRKLKHKKYYKKMLLTAGICIVVSVALAFISVSFLNDILAINRSSDLIEVEINAADDESITTNQVVRKLDKAGLIKNRLFCMVAARILGYSNHGYRSGVYTLYPGMGLENMLESIKNRNSSAAKTTTVTFPEGYTINQILDSLEKNHVCSREKMIKAMTENDYSENFSFLKGLPDKANRYYQLEGYFYPDTYEFYLGESADSVIEKFLTNFENRWTDMYALVAAERGLTLDDVVKLASVVQKEGTEDDQRIISSILLNRKDKEMPLQCDSTKEYEAKIASDSSVNYSQYSGLYNTYVCSGLPVAPICNPGDFSISAVLYAKDTDYLYFYHDSSNIIHLAYTLSEHNENIVNYP